MSNKIEGMMTKVWGPAGWLFLHSITFGYPEVIDERNDDHVHRRKSMNNFFENISGVLPCCLCRQSFTEFIQKFPIGPHLNKRVDLVRWLYKMHNLVNNKLGVPKCDIPSFKDFVLFYEEFRAGCHPTTEKEKLDRKNKGCNHAKKGYRRKRCVMTIVDNDKITCDFCKETKDDIKLFTGEKLCGKCRELKNKLITGH